MTRLTNDKKTLVQLIDKQTPTTQPIGYGSDDMNIKDICIGDSQINQYELENQNLTMILQDYADNLYEIVMTNCTHISAKGSVGFSFSTGKFTKNETGDHWFFYDEDGAVLELKFRGHTIRKI